MTAKSPKPKACDCGHLEMWPSRRRGVLLCARCALKYDMNEEEEGD